MRSWTTGSANVRHMSLDTLEVHTLLVTDPWNEFTVRPSEVAQLSSARLSEALQGSADATGQFF